MSLIGGYNSEPIRFHPYSGVTILMLTNKKARDLRAFFVLLSDLLIPT